MANEDQEILFKLKTEGDTSGAEAVKESIQSTGEVARNVEQSSHPALEETDKRLDDLKKRTEKLKQETQEFGEKQQGVNRALGLGSAAMVGVGAGGAIVAQIFKEIGESINSINIDHLRELSPVMAKQVEEVKGWAGILTDPINGIQRLLSGESLGEAFGGMNEQLKLNAENAKRTQQELANSRLEAVGKVAVAYNAETTALEKQKTELERIIVLRHQLAALATEGLDQEVRSAELRGGDVELAKSNALAAELQQGLRGLGENLQKAEVDVSIFQKKYDSSLAQYRQGAADGLNKLDPAQMEKLAIAVDSARSQLDNAEQTLQDQKQVFTTSKANLLRGVENELAALETEGSTTVSTAAQKVRDNVYASLKEEVSKLGEGTSKQMTETFSKLKDNHQKANDLIVSNTGDLIGLVKTLAEVMNGYRTDIATLREHVTHLSEGR